MSDLNALDATIAAAIDAEVPPSHAECVAMLYDARLMLNEAEAAYNEAKALNEQAAAMFNEATALSKETIRRNHAAMLDMTPSSRPN